MNYEPCKPIRSTAAEAYHVAKAAPCVVRRATVVNTSGSTLYLMVFDAAALPDDGTIPTTTPIEVAAGKANGDDWRPDGVRFEVGCVAVLSTAIASLTKVGSNAGIFFFEVI